MGQTDFSTPAKLFLALAPVKTFTILFAFFFLPKRMQMQESSAVGGDTGNEAPKKAPKATAVEMFSRNKAELEKLLSSSVPTAAQLKRIETVKLSIKKFMGKANLPAQAPRCIYTTDDVIRLVYARTHQDFNYDKN